MRRKQSVLSRWFGLTVNEGRYLDEYEFDNPGFMAKVEFFRREHGYPATDSPLVHGFVLDEIGYNRHPDK